LSIYIYGLERTRDRVKITLHTHRHMIIMPSLLLLLLRVERARFYKSLYEVCCCSSSFKRPYIYVQFLNWAIYIVYARVSTCMCVCVCVNINSYITSARVCFVEVFGAVPFTGARPYCRVGCAYHYSRTNRVTVGQLFAAVISRARNMYSGTDAV